MRSVISYWDRSSHFPKASAGLRSDSTYSPVCAFDCTIVAEVNSLAGNTEMTCRSRFN